MANRFLLLFLMASFGWIACGKNDPPRALDAPPAQTEEGPASIPVPTLDSVLTHGPLPESWDDPPAQDPPTEISHDIDPADPERWKAGYAQMLADTEDITPQQLADLFPDERLYIAETTVDPSETTYFDLVNDQMALTDAEIASLGRQGFAVRTDADRSWRTHGWGYREIYRMDLPVLITADSILHAWHKTYDPMLRDIELRMIISALTELLERLTANIPPGSGETVDLDAELFLAVPLALLTGEAATVSAGQSDRVGHFITKAIQASGLQPEELFGDQRMMDWSQFKPRGHYDGHDTLERYFRAMIWLGRIDLRLASPRQLRLMMRLHELMDEEARALWEKIDSILEAMVSEGDSLNFRQLSAFLAPHAYGEARLLGDMQVEALLDRLADAGLGTQRINSHFLAVDPYSPDPEPLPLSFAFMGQRFTVDSHVFSNVVFDRVVHQGRKIQRHQPQALDAMFSLGSPRSLDHLLEELDEYKYSDNLLALRYLIDDYPDSFWGAGYYNLWLGAIRALNVDTTGDAYPEAMRTAAWADKTLNAQLSSWTELRHDTILLVKQSYTSGAYCEYPDAYVEPYPALYRALGEGAAWGAELLASLDGEGFAYAENHLSEWTEIMATLEAIAVKELEGTQRTAEEDEFLANVIEEHEAGCVPPRYTGWYPKLFWDDSRNAVEPDFLVADVHTMPPSELGPASVKHVATAHANPIFFIAENECEQRMYVGPVSSYYEWNEPGMNRLTDEDWNERVSKENTPPRPEWMAPVLD